MQETEKAEKARLLAAIREIEAVNRELERTHARSPLNERQREACNESDAHEVLVSGGNQLGKSTLGRDYVHAHSTGKYPSWWEGVRYNRPVRIICAGESAMTIRDIMTDKMFGSDSDPDDRLFDRADIVNITTMGGAIRGAIDYADVVHRDQSGMCDGVSRIFFRSYSQKWHRLQGMAGIDIVWIDEEPEDFKVYDELSARLNQTGGYMLVTFTPLRGYTPLYEWFDDCRTGARKIIYYTIDDATHLSKERRDALHDKYGGTHYEQTRLYGKPTVGVGLVYPFLNRCIVDPYDVPKSWGKVIGLDFPHTGGHFAAVKAAVSPDHQNVVIIQDYKKDGQTTPIYASQVLRMGGATIPVAWPHDGGRGMVGGHGRTIMETYRGFGLNMARTHAEFKERDLQGRPIKRAKNQLELVVQMVFDYMAEGRFQIFSSCQGLIKEMRSYRAVDGKIKDKQDDHCIDAMHKVFMSLELATRTDEIKNAANIVTEWEFFDG